jgi:hypothetical protein
MKENIQRRRLRLERSAVSKDGSNHFIADQHFLDAFSSIT